MMNLLYTRKKFTILELLLVIAVMVILMSMLMPALRNAKEKAKQSFCASNLKQLNVALNLYYGEQGDWIPIHEIVGQNYRWFQMIFPYTGEKKDIFLCPSAVSENQWRTVYPVSLWCSYGMNYGTAFSHWGWQRITQIKQPSTTFILADGYGSPDSTPPGYHSSDLGYNADTRLVGFRHLSHANVLFFDGHIEGKNREQMFDWNIWNRNK